MIKLLIVDDSAFIRIVIRKLIEQDPKIQLVGEARNGIEAVNMAEALRPDVITMDVTMPDMDGLTATREIMSRWPCPIIMLSSLTQEGAETTIEALAAGAVDFIPKNSAITSFDIVQVGQELLDKIRYWASTKKSRKHAPAPVAPKSPQAMAEPQGEIGLVLLGVSTGGPAIIGNLLKQMGPLACPMVIAQHMPAVFTKSFAENLKRTTNLNVVEGEFGTMLQPGMVVVAPGGTDTLIREPFPGKLSISLKTKEEALIHPSVDVLFQSAMHLSVNPLAVVLTGMGRDGAQGALDLVKAKRCPVLAQEPATCVVDGMPRAVLENGAASESLTIEAIAARLAKWAGAKK
ncbi:MAG: chemotaxis-specific protein-glutamate methyltransferase CheB [Methylococcaceae bacterium]|nr:MAG: chemotaxis-specific protein-glutamate methyltransferase CheB [Methylococcaceae bacterium]